MDCKAICKTGRKCLHKATFGDYCAAHFSITFTNPKEKGLPKGCEYCKENKDCYVLKLNNPFKCSRRQTLRKLNNG